MKKVSIIVLIFMFAEMSTAQNITFMTYNIRYGLADDGDNRWDLRKEGLAEQILFYEPDVLGLQEALGLQVSFLDSLLPAYDWYGVGREDGQSEGEYSAVFYKKDKFNVIKKLTFWLSETPDEPSVGWDAALPRICTAMLLEQKETGEYFWVLNTHFDHRGFEARKQSVRLIVEKAKDLNIQNYPLILMGDFNLEPDSEAISYLSLQMNDAKHTSEGVVFGPNGTFNGFKFEVPVTKRIDYIFTDKDKTKVLKYAVLTDSNDLKYYSDHLPVYAEVEF